MLHLVSQTTPELPDDLKRPWAEAQLAKAKQDASKAEADALKAHADARKAATEADKAEAELRRNEVAALVPDLSKVEKSTLELAKDVVPGRTTALSFGALREVAEGIAETILPPGGPRRSWSILVTSEQDLASADAAYQDVTTGLKALVSAAEKLTTDLDAAPRAESIGGLEIAAALAGALPHVLSLLTAKRTLSTAAVTVGDLAAAAAVIDQLKAQPHATKIYHDDFRLLSTAGVYTLAQDVATKRQELAGRKLAYEDAKAKLEAELAAARKSSPPDPAVIAGLEAKVKAEAIRIGLLDTLIPAMDAYGTAIRTVPEGERRSPLASAALHEALHPMTDGGKPAISHVLLVKSQGGGVEQLLNNRPLWLDDKFTTVVDVSVSFMLLQTSDSQVVFSGTETRVVKAHGEIGRAPTVVVEKVPGGSD
jgi:hypothetical protein